MLLDEPFSGLDGRLKAEVRDATLAALRAAGAAALIVTHDAEEAMMMGDELALMKAGRILQARLAARVLPPARLARGRAAAWRRHRCCRRSQKNGRAETAYGTLFAAGRNGPAQVMARPEALILAAAGAPAVVTGTAFMGAATLVSLEAGGVRALARLPGTAAPNAGDAVRVVLDPTYCVVFSGDR